MPAHPLDAILANGVAVNKASTKSEVKKYSRDWGLAANFRTYDLPDTTIAVINGYLFIYDPADLTTADNGVSCVHDASARRFKRQESEVTGPGSATDNAIPRFDGTSGAVLQGSGVTISDTNVLTVPALVDLSGAAAGQVKFPATQNASADANTLDDYEEGSFTPTLLFGGAAVGMTYSYQAGRYTKIGNRVFFFLEIILTAKGSSTGTATITGQPFTNANIIGAPLAGFSTGMASLVDGFIGFIAANSATITCYTGAATGNVAATQANFTDTSRIDISGSIQV